MATAGWRRLGRGLGSSADLGATVETGDDLGSQDWVDEVGAAGGLDFRHGGREDRAGLGVWMTPRPGPQMLRGAKGIIGVIAA